MSDASEEEIDCNEESDIDFSGISSEESEGSDFEEDPYDPVGAESDDDKDGCCHWSSFRCTPPNEIIADESLDDFGSCSVNFNEDSKPHDIVERILDNTFIDRCIDATNSHGMNDQNYTSRVGLLTKDDKGRSFIRGFLAIKWHLALIRYPNKRWAWSDDPLKAQVEVKKMMPFKTFQALTKHFCVVNQSQLPGKRDPNYHPLQNILSGVEVMKDNSLSMWKSGSQICIDEGRVRSKSKRNAFKTRNPDKPIRMGWTIYKLGERGQFGNYMITNHLVNVGKKTYTSTANGKTYNIVDQLMEQHKDQGKLLVLDNGFPTVKLMKDAKILWNTRVVATQRGKSAHFPANHLTFVKQTKSFARGYSKSLHNDFLTVTYWNDNNAVTFIENDIVSGMDSWETTGYTNNQGDEIGVYIPKVAVHYRSIYGWVDRCNQQLAYYNSEFRSIRKQNRILDSLIEMYAVINGHTIWENSNLRVKKFTSASFRFEVIRIWYAIFKLHNGRHEILHYPERQPRTRRSVDKVVLSPRKGIKKQLEESLLNKC